MIPTLLVTPAQLMRPGIDRNASCTLGDCLTSSPEGCSWPRELWFLIYSCTCINHMLSAVLTTDRRNGRGKREVHVYVLLNAEVEYPCLSGEKRHLPCINFKDSARPAELPRWLSWYSICLERRRSWVRVPPEAALLFLWKKKELSSGVVACICLLSITDYSCIYIYVITVYMCSDVGSNPTWDSSFLLWQMSRLSWWCCIALLCLVYCASVII